MRRRISDTDASSPFFLDEEITELIADEGDRWRLAAASALELMAVNDVIVLKVMTRGDLKTDGAATAMAMLAIAKRLRDQDAELLVLDDESAGFEIAEMVHDDFSAREYVEKQALRRAL